MTLAAFVLALLALAGVVVLAVVQVSHHRRLRDVDALTQATAKLAEEDHEPRLSAVELDPWPPTRVIHEVRSPDPDWTH